MKYYVVDDPIIIQADGILREDITKEEIRACFKTDGPFEEDDAYYGFESYEQAVKFARASGTDTLQYPIFEVEYEGKDVQKRYFKPLSNAQSQKIKGVSLNVHVNLTVISGSLEHANPTTEGAKKIFAKENFAPILDGAAKEVEVDKVKVKKLSYDVIKLSKDNIKKISDEFNNVADAISVANSSHSSAWKIIGVADAVMLLASVAYLLGSISLAVLVGLGVTGLFAVTTLCVFEVIASKKLLAKMVGESENTKIAIEKEIIAALEDLILLIAPEDKALIDMFGEKLSDAVPRYDAKGKETPADKKDLFLGLCYEREKLQTLFAQKDKAKHPELVAEIKADLEKQKFLRATA